jgi:hypothetical protein
MGLGQGTSHRHRITFLAFPLVTLLLLVIGAQRAIGGSLPRASDPYRYCADERTVYRGGAVFLGVNEQLDNRGLADMQCAAGRMAADHLGYVCAQLSWAEVETAPNQFDFAVDDQIMAILATHHLEWLPVVLPAPSFLDPGGQAPSSGFSPPADPRQFAAFMKLLVRRYGPHGSFWRSHRSIPYDPIRSWVIWNEPSLEIYWVPKPSAKAYTTLLRDAYGAIKSVDRSAQVVAAGVPFVAGINFYQQMYRDGAGKYFNVLAFHDYSAKVQYAEEDLALLRQTMDRYGGKRTPIWVTEFGWAYEDRGPFTAGAATPSRVARLMSYIVHQRRTLGIGKVFYYNWRDPPSGGANWWGLHMGMYRLNGSPRPIAATITRLAAKLNR